MKYVDALWYWKKKQVSLDCLLRKMITRKNFVQLKTINTLGRKATFSFRLSSSYFAFRCKNYICNKRSRFRLTMGTCSTLKGFIFLEFPLLSERDVIKYDLDTFYHCRGFEGLNKKNTYGKYHRYPKTFQCDNGTECKSYLKKLLKKPKAGIRKTTAKYKHTRIAFGETCNKETAKQFN